MILHIDLTTKFIANKIETEERFCVLKVFSQFSDAKGYVLVVRSGQNKFYGPDT